MLSKELNSEIPVGPSRPENSGVLHAEGQLVLVAILGVCFIVCRQSSARAEQKTIAERLGYAADAKLLIIHADDLAVAHSEDSARFEALDRQYVTSASIIVPAPWLAEVADYAKTHPDADLGLHLALTSEWKSFR